MTINLGYYTLIHETRSFAQMSDVNLELVRVQPGTPFVPHAKVELNGKRTLVLQQPEVDWNEEQIIKWRGDFYHELSHFNPAHKDDYVLAREHKIDMSTFYGTGINSICDYKIEKHDHGVYVGRDMHLSKSNQVIIKKIMDKYEHEFPKLDPKSDEGVMFTMLTFDTLCREDWQRDLTGMGDALKSKLSPGCRDMVDKLLDNGYKEKLNDVSTAEEGKALWDDMLTNIFQRDAQEELQNAQQQSKEGKQGEGSAAAKKVAKDGRADHSATGNEKGKDSNGESSKDDGEADGEGNGMEGGSGSGAESVRQEAGKISWRDIKKMEHDTPESATYTPLKIDYHGYRASKTFDVNEKHDVRDYEKNTGNVHTEINYRYDDMTRNVNAHSGLSNKIRKILQVKTQSLNVHGQKKGKLSNRNLYRATQSGTGENQQRVFRKKVQQFDLDTAVTVLIDFSGSMGGDKMVHAIASGMMLNEAISKIGVPLEILGFTDRMSNSIINIFKTFRKPVPTEMLRQRFLRGTNSMSANADGEAILYAYDRLAKQTNKRKVLIVLSDGQPASSRGDCYQFTKDVIDKIHKEKRIEIYGIGIMDDTVKELYPHYSVIQHENELEAAVLNVVKKHILK